jgi:hypothetical protein
LTCFEPINGENGAKKPEAKARNREKPVTVEFVVGEDDLR